MPARPQMVFVLAGSFLEFGQSLAMIWGSIRVDPLDENGRHPGSDLGGGGSLRPSRLCLREFGPSHIEVDNSIGRTMGPGSH
jgi:hypothetical protein